MQEFEANFVVQTSAKVLIIAFVENIEILA
jgi:hypothetical protein